MKIYSICTPSHRQLRDEWFIPTLRDRLPVEVMEVAQTGDGSIGNEAFNAVMLQKVRLILRAIEEQWGQWFIYSDVDVQFLRPVEPLAKHCLSKLDICFQQDSPTGELCAGFFAARANESVRRLWLDVELRLAEDLSQHDQTWLNRILDPKEFITKKECSPQVRWIWKISRGLRLLLKTYRFCPLERWARLQVQSLYGLRIGLFPTCVFGAGTMTGKAWDPAHPFRVPGDACVHHANYAAGTTAKIDQFRWVRLNSQSTPSQATQRIA